MSAGAERPTTEGEPMAMTMTAQTHRLIARATLAAWETAIKASRLDDERSHRLAERFALLKERAKANVA